MHGTFRLENLKGRDHFRALGIVGEIMSKWIFEKWGVKMWTGFNWLRIVSSDLHY
jgi:uncharacterized membrane protein YeaQ/YmgE (transglycosylase-associated protein family)